MRHLPSPAVQTYLLSGAFAVVTGAALTSSVADDPVVHLAIAPVPLAVGLGLLFFLSEQLLMNIEFRRQAHSFTLAGVPLALGVLLAGPHELVLARVIGSVLAFAVQRISVEKTVYNTAAYAFEAAVDVTVVHALCAGRPLDLLTAALLVLVIAGTDQLMCLSVVVLIRAHGGEVGRRDVLDIQLPAVVLTTSASVAALGAILLLRQGALGAAVVVAMLSAGALAYRTHSQTRQRHGALSLVHDFVTEGAGVESTTTLADHLLGRIRRLLRAGRVEVTLVELADWEEITRTGHADHVRTTVLIVDEDDTLSVHQGSWDQADWMTSRAMFSDEPLLAVRSTRDTGLRKWLADRQLRDAMIVSIPATTGLEGTVLVADRLGETATFTPDDLAMLQTLTGHLAVSLHSAQLVERLGYDASHDSLTGLANRANLAQRIDQVLASEQEAAVMLLDLNGFKDVNDALGHDVGDRLLVVVAERLLAALPATATVARLGGDEFAVLLPSWDGTPAGIAGIIADVTAALAVPVEFDEARVTPEASIGVSLSTAASLQSDLLRQSDTAMYVAKAGGLRYAVYDESMDSGRMERLALLSDLRLALTAHPHQFQLQYQPKIDVHDGRVLGAEALVRWHHPTRGVVAPDTFIPLAESTGLIAALTPLVLARAIADTALWAADGHDLSVAVNLSAQNVNDPELPARISALLALHALAPERLILEITESSIVGDFDETLPVLHALRELGVCLSLDDFGTGYSSLSYLQRLPVGEVKIDRSFVLGLAGQDRDNSRALIQAISSLGEHLGLRVVAEGVEDAATLSELRVLGCDVAQGYHISRPLTAADFDTWLAAETAASDRHGRGVRQLRPGLSATA